MSQQLHGLDEWDGFLLQNKCYEGIFLGGPGIGSTTIFDVLLVMEMSEQMVSEQLCSEDSLWDPGSATALLHAQGRSSASTTDGWRCGLSVLIAFCYRNSGVIYIYLHKNYIYSRYYVYLYMHIYTHMHDIMAYFYVYIVIYMNAHFHQGIC